jgi:choline dehydrogenase-like flavoprotein
MELAVVGSGISGVAAARALVARGLRVTLLDVGETLERDRSAVVEKLRTLPRAAWPAADYELIHANPTFGTRDLPKKVHFGSDYIYASDREFARIVSLAKGRAPFPTFARGGFSNIWGAAVLPPDDCDMADWPISRAELEPYLRKVAEYLPICGGEGTLADAFPAYKERLGELKPGAQGDALLGDLRRAASRLSAARALYGKARLAIHTAEDELGSLPCNDCGECFTGCVRGSIFSTRPLLDQMIREGRVQYCPGIFVETVAEERSKVAVSVLDLGQHERRRLSFDAIFLAGGPINTTRLLLQSRGLYGRKLRLKESQKFVVPALRRRAALTAVDEPAVTLASVFLETKVAVLSDHWFHVQIVPMNQMILDGLALPGQKRWLGNLLWTPLLRRVMVGFCGMHSDHSSHLELCLRPADQSGAERLELELCVSEAARAMARQAANDLFRKGLMFGTLFFPRMIKFSNPGSGTHCGSSFPMRRRPVAPVDSDSLGRPFGWSRVFAVDSSVLPSIPGTTLAFSVMANAYRIAATAPLE